MAHRASVVGVISGFRTEHGISHRVSCRAPSVSESWFYKHRARRPTWRELRRQHLIEAVKEEFDDSGGTYGSPETWIRRVRQDWRVSVNTIARIMAELGLVARKVRRRRGLTRPGKRPAAPDFVRRDFSAEAPDLVWCGDMTEIETGEGKLYLATVVDLFSRRLLGCAMGARHDAELVVAALHMAAATRGGDVRGAIFTLPDAEGTVTQFTKPDSTATTWQVSSTLLDGLTNSTTTVVSETVTVGDKKLARPKRVIAPTSAATTAACTATPSTKDCRALEFVYATTTTATSGSYGDIANQVKEIRLWSTEPGAAAATSKTVQTYLYDGNARLRQAWNPPDHPVPEDGVRLRQRGPRHAVHPAGWPDHQYHGLGRRHLPGRLRCRRLRRHRRHARLLRHRHAAHPRPGHRPLRLVRPDLPLRRPRPTDDRRGHLRDDLHPAHLHLRQPRQPQPAFEDWSRLIPRRGHIYHLGNTPAKVRAAFWQLVARADRTPLLYQGDDPVRRNEALTGADIRSWLRPAFFAEPHQAAREIVTLRKSRPTHRTSGPGTTAADPTDDNTMALNWAITCADNTASRPRDPARYRGDALRERARHPRRQHGRGSRRTEPVGPPGPVGQWP